MEGNVIPVSEGMTIIVKASGDLFLQGAEPMEVGFQSNDDRVRVNHTKDTLYIESHANLDLVTPRGLPVIIEKTGGSAFIQDLDQSIVVQKVGGDLALRRIGALKLEKVGGSCLIEDVDQALDIHKIGGDLTLRGSVGSLQISSIGGSGNLQITGDGPVQVRAGGDLKLYFSNRISEAVTMRAGANADVFLPALVNGVFTLDSGGESIDIRMNRQSAPIVESIDAHRHTFTVGEGGPAVEIRVGSDIRISDDEVQPDPITEDLDRRENAWKKARDRSGGNPSWSFGFGFDRTSAWADMISRRAQEAAQRAEHRAHRAMRRTEDQIRQAAEREMRRTEAHYGMPPVPPTPPPPPTPKVSEQERLMVLKMLQENKISVDQAEKLLAALEGRF